LNGRSVLCCCATSWTKHWKGALQIRRSVDFWYCQISRSYVVQNVRKTVRIGVSYMLGIAHIEVMTWSPTHSNCSWMILMPPPCCWHCRPCSLCSQLLSRGFRGRVDFFASCFVLAIMKVLLF
jgi:hypothetical protein